MAISTLMKKKLEASSLIRKMFDDGKRLRKLHGDRVCDFSLGNPSMSPPKEFTETLEKLIKSDIPEKHSYMTNAGYPAVRDSIAETISEETGVEFEGKHLIMTCGAGGALNIAFKAIINPGDEILVSTPCFLVYDAYVSNHGGSLRLIDGKEDFSPDIDAIEAAITPKTAALIINSPNNPSGAVYSEETINEIAAMLKKKSAEINREIYIISDEPYRKIIYDDAVVPSIPAAYKNTIMVTSYSKDLSIPGERIGWAAVHPEADDAEDLLNAMVMCNRDLGYTNAPALMQRAVAESHKACIDVDIYKRKRDLFVKNLKEIGYELQEPKGTFYLFPKAPGGDDARFTEILKEELILTVPGRGFGKPGYFRISYCVPDEVIEQSFEGFRRALKKVLKEAV